MQKDKPLKIWILFLWIMSGYLLLIIISWIFFSCEEFHKITTCLMFGLFTNLILCTFSEIAFQVSIIKLKINKYINVFAILAGIITVISTYLWGENCTYIRNDILKKYTCKNCECSCIEIPVKLIPSGTYQIGISDNLQSRIDSLFPDMNAFLIDEKPRHTVILDSFYMSEYEITNDIYYCYAKEKKIDFSCSASEMLKPKSNISWYEAKDFCYWLSGKTGLSIDLPSEAQWEVAAGNDIIFPWGDSYPTINICNFNSTYNETTCIDTINNTSTPFGLINMAGNVAEWCSDWYDESYYSNFNNTPIGPTTGNRKVVRGGSWKDNAFDVRITKRNSYPPDTKNNKTGFRITINNYQFKNGGNQNENFKFSSSGNAFIIINGM